MFVSSQKFERGYSGQTRIGLTEVVQPTRKGQSSQNAYQKRKYLKRINRRAANRSTVT